ncbi:hypothetical protein ACQR1I_18185 [Bradyrhizobium sp. HKCCYLS2038]|uniref:hypothetical protein n=1 Tax=unclassified Bradyrhizobium TaxID=2631580 RepID=UPI003EBF3084
MDRLLQRICRWMRAEIVIGFLVSTLFWIAVLGWQAAYAPTEAQRQKCFELAEHSGLKGDECRSIWERTTSDPVALFTLVLAISTVGLWIATIGLYKAGERQLRFLKKSSAIQFRDTQKSIAVADRSAKAAERALSELERPWIFVHLSRHLVSRGDDANSFGAPPVAVFEIANHGRMPATIAACYIALEGVHQTEPSSGLLRDEFHISIGPQERSGKLQVDCPGGLAKYGVVVDLLSQEVHPVPELDQLESFFFYILLEYSDVRGKSYTSSFCWRFDLGVNYWVGFGGRQRNYLT